MLAFLRFLFWQPDICPFVSRVSQIALSHRGITLLSLLPVFIPSLGHYFWCSQVSVLHFCWQLPNLFFYQYPLTLSWLSLCCAWLAWWHSRLEWMASNFLKLNCSLKSCLSTTFTSVFLIFHSLWWMQQNLSWLRSVTNINKLLVLHHGSINSNSKLKFS